MDATDLQDEAPRIALALAAELITFDEVPEHFNIGQSEWNEFKFKPYFQRLYRDQKEQWGGEINATKRIKLKTQAMLESSLPVLHEVATDTNMHPSNRLEAVKQMERLAGVEREAAEAAGAGSGFHLEINIGTDRGGVETITLDGGDMQRSTQGVIPRYDGDATRAPEIPYDETSNWELQAGMANELPED